MSRIFVGQPQKMATTTKCVHTITTALAPVDIIPPVIYKTLNLYGDKYQLQYYFNCKIPIIFLMSFFHHNVLLVSAKFHEKTVHVFATYVNIEIWMYTWTIHVKKGSHQQKQALDEK